MLILESGSVGQAEGRHGRDPILIFRGMLGGPSRGKVWERLQECGDF